MKIEGITTQQIADELQIAYDTAHKRLERLGIKPITTGAIYPMSALEAVKKFSGPGRPRKAKPEEPATKKPAKK
ncbi:MAG: hypothetical protein LBF74_07385 [Treponema sp.]|jgi:hypothetical protein|nr:hypothetical protein [Treponema sp.]